MDARAWAAQHYRGRGYDVRQEVKVRGQSGNIWALDMVAQGPLGSLVVTFGGHDGVDAADVAHIRRVAKDVGASGVVAGAGLHTTIRHLAQREGVAVLDADQPPPAAQDPLVMPWPGQRGSPDDAEALHPWPASGRARDPARTALRSVALDDLLSDEGRRVDATAEPEQATPAQPAAAFPGTPPRPGAPTVGQPRTRPVVDGAALLEKARRFSWLQPASPLPSGGYEFLDAQPAPRAAHPSSARDRDAVLAEVREHVGAKPRRSVADAGVGGPIDLLGEAGPGAGRRASDATALDRPTGARARGSPAWWVAAALLAGGAAGASWWLLARFLG